MPPFTISASGTSIHADPAEYRVRFNEQSSLLFEDVFEPDFLAKLVSNAAAAPFVENMVENIGLREMEAQQRIGATISLLLGRLDFLDWLEQATGITPLRATMGRLVQTRANGEDALEWHNDMDADHRQLGLVMNLSDQPFEGGIFEMRHTGTETPFRTVKHDRPGSIMIFAVNPNIEHRVTMVESGGPRRVYAGWAVSRPEHDSDPLARPDHG